MAPRPFSQAWGGETEGWSITPELPPQPWPWHLCTSQPVHGTHLLVLLQGYTGLGPILSLNEQQLVPLDVF
jgi:hypothetical protein